ncbi:hypothetical protein [Nocardia salmonicida]|uniref:hypothetical protein n=1 Tax=Nocardia salmonicida TaxID=53431 RepID=UPI002E2C6F6E|nr:hypothetical protein [Nocardia salmonicida]
MLRWTDTILDEHALGEVARAEALELFSVTELADLVLTVGFYQLVCNFLNTFDVTTEGESLGAARQRCPELERARGISNADLPAHGSPWTHRYRPSPRQNCSSMVRSESSAEEYSSAVGAVLDEIGFEMASGTHLSDQWRFILLGNRIQRSSAFTRQTNGRTTQPGPRHSIIYHRMATARRIGGRHIPRVLGLTDIR